MRAAVAAVLEGRTVYSVDKETGINMMTLKSYVKKTRANPNMLCRPYYVIKQIFTNEKEKSLSEYLLRAAKLHYGLSTKTTRKLVYEFAISLSKDVPKSWHSTKSAGQDWLQGFISRRK